MTPDERQNQLALFPPVLRELLAAELAAGNRIVEISGSFPAPPVGAWAMLERPVTTRPRESGGGIRFRERNDSLYSGEFSDSKGHWFVLEPPLPPPPPPDMDAIRAGFEERSTYRPAQATDVAFALEVDHRGDMLTYREQDRMTTVIFNGGDDPYLLVRTLAGWWYPEEKRSEAMGAKEKSAVLERIAGHCSRVPGMSGMRLEEG